MKPINKQRFILFLTLLVTGLSVIFVCIYVLYHASLATWKEKVRGEAAIWAQFIEVVSDFDKQYRGDFPGGSKAATMSQIRKAHFNLHHFGDSAEFVIAELDVDRIRFIFRHQHGLPKESPLELPLDSSLAEPMRRALRGESGEIFGLDYDGHQVLAAFHPLPGFGAGMVYKIDMAELRAPFVNAAWISCVASFLLVILGSFFFFRFTEPMLQILQDSNADLIDQIKKREKAERQILESKQMLQTILDTLPVRVFWKNRDLKYLGCNKPFAEDSGWGEPQKLIGKDDFAMSWKGNAEAFREDDRWVVETGKTRLNIEEKLPREDGSFKWLRTGKVPLKDFDGRIVGVLGVFLDITEEKKTKENLRISEQRLAQVIESTSGWIWEVDSKGLYTYSNYAVEGLLGYLPEDIVGKKHFYDLFLSEYREKIKSEAFEVFSRRENFSNFINRVRHKDGRQVVLSTNGSPILDSQGNLLGYRGVDLDVTEEQRMIEALRGSEEKYRSIFEGESDAFILIEKQSKQIRDANRSAIELFGYSRKELVEMKITDLSAEPEKTRDSVESLVPGRFSRILKRLYRKKDGTMLPVEISAGCFLLGDEQIVFGAMRDISQRLAAETQLRILGRAVDQSPTSIVITNPNGNIEYVNPHFCALTGYSEEDCMGKKPNFLKSGEHSREFYKNLWDTILAGKTWQGEFKNKKKNGEFYWESTLISPVRVDGKIAHFVGIKEDITRKREIQRELESSEARFRALIDNAYDAIFVHDEDGRFLDINRGACRSLGYTRDELMSLNAADIQKGLKREDLENAWRRILKGERMVLEGIHTRKDRTKFPVEVNMDKMQESGRSVILAVARDLSERKKVEEALRLTQQQLMASQKLAGIGQLAAGVSHEVLNPVNIISVHTQLLERKRKEDADLQEFCKKVRHEVSRIEKIMGALLTFSRKGDSQKERVTIREVLESVMDLVERDFELDNIKIERVCSPKDLAIYGDRDKLRQVFLNLVNNAKYAMHGSGKLLVGCRLIRRDDIDWVEAFVEDTGTGISKENLEQLFVPFFTTKPEGEGTGMGLAVVHGIVEEHGGHIRVESEEGRGTKIIIEFPAV